MLRNLVLLSVLSTCTSAAIVGTGENGDFCGDTGLGFSASLIDAIKGTGSMSYSSGSPTHPVTILKNQIISSRYRSGSTTVVQSKQTECIYDVNVDFAESNVKLMTGAPGVKNQTDLQRCWVFAVEDTTYTFKVGTRGGPCPSSTVTPAEDGTINNVESTIPQQLGALCNNTGLQSTLPVSLTGYGVTAPSTNSYIWLTPTSFVLSTTDYGIMSATQTCIASANEPDVSTDPYTFTSVETGACTAIKMNTRVGVIQSLDSQTSTCPTWSDASASVFPLVFVNLPPGGTDATTGAGAANAPPKVPTEMKTLPVVTYGLSLTSGSLTAISVADPCTAVKLRIASAATISGAAVAGLILTSVTQGSLTIPLTADSPANVFTTVPDFCTTSGAASRRLRNMMAMDVIRGMNQADIVSMQAHARQLQTPVNVNFQVVVPPGQSATSFATTVNNAATPVISGATVAQVGSAVATIASVAVPVTFPPRVNPYIPDPMIVLFHSIPRFSLGDDTPSNQFSTDMSYIQGALYPAGGIIALGFISLIAYSLAYTCGCCACTKCKCRHKRDPALYSTGCKKYCSTPNMFIVVTIINIAILLSILQNLRSFNDGIGTIYEALGDFVDVASDSGDLMSSPNMLMSNAGTLIPSMADSCDGAEFAATQASAACAAGNPTCVSAITSILSAVESAAGMAGSAARDVGTTLISTSKTMKDTQSSVDIKSIQDLLTNAGYGLVGFVCAVIFLIAMTTSKRYNCCICYRLMAPCNILLTTLVIILAGAYYAIGIIGADICVDPTSIILDFAGASKTGLVPTGDLVKDTITFYFRCGENPAMPTMGAYKMLADNIDTLHGGVNQLIELDAQITSNPSSPAFSALAPPVPWSGYMARNMSAALDGVSTIRDDTLSCIRIDTIFSKLFHGLCNGGFASAIYLFRALMAVGILLIIQLGIGVDICCFHPGDKSRWLNADEAAAAAEGGKPISSHAPAANVTPSGTFQAQNPHVAPRSNANQTLV